MGRPKGGPKWEAKRGGQRGRPKGRLNGEAKWGGQRVRPKREAKR